MEWKEYPKEKPQGDAVVYVANTKAGYECYHAIYNSKYDFFRWYHPDIRHQPPIEATHWMQFPEPPDIRM